MFRSILHGSKFMHRLHGFDMVTKVSQLVEEMTQLVVPRELGAKSDAYANGLHKGDVFAHLTSLKKTSESNIQTKRLSKRSPMLPLSLSSELSTADNRRR
ncbi:hypothetical protein F511_25580 [Dorcoceras hygrometricum]|uniref:Uncharacterized protein n=1 Tax=Dorcoceras hygrometricum TaxID=472368 RepID=A0A2Z7B229_9LAMI|nr:hypothetical protein F511_25580 [Dorcoceras hygrometricum]